MAHAEFRSGRSTRNQAIRQERGSGRGHRELHHHLKGKRYGSFHGKLARRQKRDREKRRRKAKLRACLKQKAITKLPSMSSASGQRLGRHVRQEINRAVNLMIADHLHARIIYEDLSVASMRFKARSMNAYLSASNLAHIPKQIAWATAKRAMAAHAVKAVYSSQECRGEGSPDFAA